ncbi:terminase small subunit [Clostridiales bacterium oral taxon 876 str. F0540]|nr:terminase small subunit [Clostridiales bacterium oral taxon 876 str. F0540]
MAKLSLKQKIFCDEYLIDLNATQAAIRAGYSFSTAKEIGSENLTKPNIRAYIEKAMAERSRRTGINQDRVIRELAKVAFINIADVIDIDNVTVKEDASEDDLAAIASVKVKRYNSENGNSVEREIKFADKLKALELLGKHLGMFKDKIDINASLGIGLEKLNSILEQLRDNKDDLELE